MNCEHGEEQSRAKRKGGRRNETRFFTGGNGENRDELKKLRFLCSLLLEEVSLRKDDFLSRISRRPRR